MTSVGAVLVPQFPPERMRSIAVAAEEAGLEELWLWEDCFLQGGIASAAALLAWTRRLRIGIGVLPVPLRNVALTAMEVATLHRLFPDRVTVGVGHGVQDWMAQVGARAESPMTLLREYLDALRALMRGERVTTHGRYVHLDDVALDWPPTTPPPILAGATGPRTLRLTGEAADGAILTARTTPAQVRQAHDTIAEARAALPGPHPLVVNVLAATGPDARTRLAAERRRRNYPPATPTEVAGDPQDAAYALTHWAAAGATHLILQPTADDPDPEAFIRFAAQTATLLTH
ncbi:LLM class flavin-dependent oxidoreductase [Nonomuraea sp. NPDC050536]|uniref:LLM class flavin-dependent oxidoreductase n=1 Tax=Nonomuraea sp. NPDC050536 TaxID=3364366 RepID=UPI0037C6FCB8